MHRRRNENHCTQRSIDRRSYERANLGSATERARPCALGGKPAQAYWIGHEARATSHRSLPLGLRRQAGTIARSDQNMAVELRACGLERHSAYSEIIGSR